MHLLCRELLAAGRKVSVVLGFNSADEVVLLDSFRAMGVEPAVATPRRQHGHQRLRDRRLRQSSRRLRPLYCCGPLPMMKAVCEALDIPARPALRRGWAAGAGFCYGCSKLMKGGARRICKDGPVFDKEEIIW